MRKFNVEKGKKKKKKKKERKKEKASDARILQQLKEVHSEFWLGYNKYLTQDQEKL